MFEVGDIVLCVHEAWPNRGYGLVVEVKDKDKYHLYGNWCGICFFNDPHRVTWYEGKDLRKADEIQHR